MKTEIVAYHNDFNKVTLPDFSIQEHNILMGILSRIQNIDAKNIITMYPKELKQFSNKNNTNTELTKIVEALYTNFFNANFTIIKDYPDENLEAKERIHFFRKFTIYTDKTTKSIEKIELQVEEDFVYLVNNLIGNFTSFELAEFLTLKSKYSKTLYRLLKQFKHTGKCLVYTKSWEDFRSFMNIPSKYTTNNIDDRVLNPVIVELSPIFKGLYYEKIKEKGSRGRGGKIIGIEFYFDPQITKNIKNINGENNNETNNTTN